MSQTIENLPTGWAWVKLGEVCESINPGFPSGKHNQESQGVPHLRPMNINGLGEIDLSVLKFVPVENYQSLDAGDVLFNNTNSPELLGKTALISENENWAYSNHMTRIRVFKSVAHPSFVAKHLHFLFKNGFFKINCVNHVNQASIGKSFLENRVEIPLPPHPEQIRIVQKLESLLTRLARAEQALAAAETGLARFRQSVLKAAFRAEDAAGKLKEGWRRVKLGEVCELITKGSSPSWQGIQYVDREEVLFVTSENVRENFLDLSSPKYLEFGFNEKQRRSILKKGDVLLNIVGASIGRAAIFDLEKLANINQAVCVIRPKPELSNHFLSFFLNSATAKTYYDTSKVDVARANLSLKDVNELGFPLPDLPTQAQIVQKIEHALTRARALETAVQTARAECARLRQSILREAFAGRLVPQDPADEPAEALLARLRAGVGKAPKTRQKK